MSNIKIDKRIVGGCYVDSTNKYPFMATMWYLDGDSYKFKSGAVFLGKRYFMTAAHCVRNRNIEMMLVRLGHTCLRNLPYTFKVKKIYTHPGYTGKDMKNDIAILEIDEDLNRDGVRLPCDHLKNVCYNYGHSVKVLGYGKDCEYSSQEHLFDLKEVDLKVIPLEESKYHRKMVTNEMFLASNNVNGKIVDACTGDSGGPCIKWIKNEWVLVGIVSWGSGCGQRNLPGVYTKVLPYHNWVRGICKFGGCGKH
jgi:plasminogen activator